MSQYGSQASHSFPVLKLKEILACLKELQIPMTSDELKNPTIDKMKGVYEMFLTILMGISKDDFRQPVFGALDALPFPELHENSLPEISFYKYLLRLMKSCGLHDCTLVHLVKPVYQDKNIECDTRRIMSALINFAKFREERLMSYQSFTSQTDELVELKNKLEQESEQQDAQFKALSDEHKKVVPIKEKLEEETQRLETSLTKLHGQAQMIRDANRVMKQEMTELDDNIANDKFAILNYKSDCELLGSQIVRSPEKIKQQLRDMEGQKDAEKTEIVDLASKLRLLQTKVKAMDLVDLKLEERVVTMVDINSDFEKSNALKQETHKLSKEAKQLGNSSNEQSSQAGYLNKQLSENQDKLFKLQRKFESQRHKADQNLREEESRQMELEFSAESERALMVQQTSIVDKKKLEIERLKAEHTGEMDNLREKYSLFQQQLAKYHSDLMTAMAN